ncbi:isoleucyl-tRNA synthetase [Synechocystis sp. PCC 6803]|uniref:Isoleucine--tRNA ligase n=1 Tax=Synechocystis sp. (strain ATCC 27184 / PCC 6803 / Kazusa) TaxID=1111708 RepID=SYI_SYNY3|nr:MULTISPECIES: isoleucine--tRNA ligase [unclassified Synechocystis]P73505.1 RecName: Full=Isoleucine--tRNA ligase; AltName: Full=Isoleucyl-tRNA synthetase; Short=IleRS [Synechocystis sp. PCC 6803 substr. Kazusa]MBD2618460.1 isoleucine--tRNA ligase [Synechocystis sp. FACHB-898]MBD2640129.1 isoleucine--tRNA ligase [Synechocystis sp. FACHB-908]MBD2660866.1 isoleucine--tRNA ligase [Synechocystis sp. FACHB-929]BAM51282.1 isoleucyl-tRNA synthetase [Synechocystis sp. PCC 6803] [Bacillus subtilis BE
MTEAKSYKDTVNLPQTRFDMRANANKREPEIQQYWQEKGIYADLADNNPKDLFVLHDGPPYANGALHMGHALNKVLKDIINKYKLLQGHKVHYVPGWDCHGLPIELKVLQSLKSSERAELTPLTLRHKARDFALKAQQEQAVGFQRYGIWGDWKKPYLTLTPEYEAAQIGVFGAMALKGYIYRGLKPVHWSPSSRTALAEAELEYPEGHTSRSIYVSFPITQAGEKAAEILAPYIDDLAVAIWTTTPWTLPGNLAVALNPELTYAVVETESHIFHRSYLIVALDLVEKLSETFGVKLTVKVTLQGESLENTCYQHPLFDRVSPIVIGGDYVTTESGTGLVHTAPGHGQEDYVVGQRYGLPILSPVDAAGNLTEEAGKFAGLNVLNDANEAIINALQDQKVLLKEEAYEHKYPYDWRTKKPTIFRATEQWFASVEGFRDQALKAIKEVTWIPTQGENRITPMVGDRSDWCISRQRAWGVPIPVFYDEETSEPLLTEETINHVQQIIAEKGSDAWWELTVEELLPEAYRNNGRTYRKGEDTMDVWFDSGSSWAAVANAKNRPLKYPVDMYLEGSDQHRGWFQSSLLTSVAVNGIAPYKTVLTHGFVLDEKGHKMSKSLGNVVDPYQIINGGKNQKQEPAYGADVLRLWVASVDYANDVPIGQGILKQLVDIRNKIRNTARFLLGNLHDFNPETDAVAYEDLPELDRYMLHRMTEVFTEVTEAYESFQFFKFFQTVQNFCVVDLSNFYLDIAKDRLYISAPNAPRRRSCQTILQLALENLTKAIAPVLCHLAEDIWQFLPYEKPTESVFQSGWVNLDAQWQQPQLAQKWVSLRQLRDGINQLLEQARRDKVIGSSLEAKLIIVDPRTAESGTDEKQGENFVHWFYGWLENFNEPTFDPNDRKISLRNIFLTSQVEFIKSAEIEPSFTYEETVVINLERHDNNIRTKPIKIIVTKADGHKCERCWNYSTQVGSFSDDPTICERCNEALQGNF